VLSLYEFQCKVYRDFRKPNDKKSDQEFLVEHPLYLTHILRLRKEEVIPILHGKKIKYLTKDSSAKVKEDAAIMSLVLYKPFRNAVNDLKGDFDSWYDAFKS